MTTTARLLGPWRRRFQWLISLLILLIPWVQFNNVSLLRVDFPSMSLQLFGSSLRIEELYLLLIFSLGFALFFLFATLVFGRVWCGWACPQTTLSDLAEWAGVKLGLKIKNNRVLGSPLRKLMLQAFFLLLALLVACNLLWYFVAPLEFFRGLATASLHPVATGFLLITAATVYLDLAFLRRLVCREFCPYGRFQTVLVDPATLTLTLPEMESARCIECGSCVRACPMEIDIRRGYQIECINCGRCLDACRKIMFKRNEPGLIGYHFGSEQHRWQDLVNPRTILLAAGFISLAILLSVALLNRTEASLKIALSHQVSSRRLADGTQATFFNAWVNNRTGESNRYSLQAHYAPDNTDLTLKGPTQDIQLAAGENRKVDFVLVTPFSEADIQVTFELVDDAGRILDSTQAQVTARQSRER